AFRAPSALRASHSGVLRGSWFQQLGNQPARSRFASQLFIRALPRRLVRPPAQEPRAVPEASAGHLVVAHLHDQYGLHGAPLARALGAPAARPTGRLAGEAGSARDSAQPLRERLALARRNGGGEPHVIEQPLAIEEPEEERPDLLLAAARQPVPAD